MVVAAEAGAKGLGILVQDLGAYFYENRGLVVSTQPEMLQRESDVLADLFGRFGLQIITRKKVSMAYQPCHMPDRMSEVAYERRVMELEPTYQERQRLRV